ncbi:RteC domain-containing protein [Salegentibacter sp. LM13S]|uniref:RteC domain-containing protein n=1 Tax=Salegentibacter lacus TaxID=2873599 RepID=UPI001CD03667|nr:RteC domain-containing protein [Salegentibacter lacus]MBZ9629765.1 RteC domain-containing protein [Salegentibacter lacus]
MFEKAISMFTDQVDRIINSESSSLKKAESGIRLCNRTLSELQHMVEKEDFEDSAAEINFFKNIKPIPMSYLIYFTEVRTCELSIPKAGNNPKIRFLEKEVKKINKFFSQTKDFVNYMEQSHNYMDPQYFTRNNLDYHPFAPTINYYQYPEFSTSHDMLWAMIQAMYKFIHYIREKLQKLQPGNKSLYAEKQPKLLLWSGSKTALVELIYALYADGSLNHGNVEISTIISSFEDFFNTKLDQGYKTYSDIKARKGDRTKYLNQLILKLENKMRRDDGL